MLFSIGNPTISKTKQNHQIILIPLTFSENQEKLMKINENLRKSMEISEKSMKSYRFLLILEDDVDHIRLQEYRLQRPVRPFSIRWTFFSMPST